MTVDKLPEYEKQLNASAASASRSAVLLGLDLQAEYRVLFGKELTNMTELSQEAAASRAPDFRKFVENKFGFTARRAEIQAAETNKREDVLRAEGFAQAAKQYGANPAYRVMVPSRAPFTAARPVSGGGPTGDAKFPWQANPAELAAKRRQAVLDKQLSSGMLN